MLRSRDRLADEISGETDVRLRVRANARPVCVELWCCPDEAALGARYLLLG